MRNREPRCTNCREQGFVERSLPLGVGRVEEIGARRPSDVVHENVEPAESFDGLVHHERNAVRRRHVRLHGHDHVRTTRDGLDLDRRRRELL
jgi:hypothetical protein